MSNRYRQLENWLLLYPTGPRYNKASKNSNWNRSAKHIYGGQSHRPKIQIIVNTGCDR